MARHSFGNSLADYTITAGVGNVATLAGSQVVKFYTAITGGTQYTDLSTAADGSVPVTQVTTSDGTDGLAIGTIPQVYGPDGVTAMWAVVGTGPRALIVATDIGADAAAALSTANSAIAALTSHASARNPHSTRLSDLSGVAVADATTGQVLALASGGTWQPLTVSGVTGTAQLAGNNTFTGSQVFSPATTLEPGTTSYAAAGQSANRNLVYIAGSTSTLASYLTPGGDERRSPSATTAVARRTQALISQTANLEEWADSSGTTAAWVDPSGRVRAPNLGLKYEFSLAGALTVTTGAHRVYNDTGVSLTIRAVRASVGTAPTGAAILVDLNINGSTAFSTQANRPTIAISGNTSGKVTAINTTTLADGDYMTVDVDQVGSTVAGSNLVVQVLAY